MKKIVLPMFLLSLFSLFACGTENNINNVKDIDFVVGYQGPGFGEDKECIINNLSEWNALKYGHVVVPDLAKYDEVFFVESSLLVYEFTLSYGGGNIDIVKVSVSDSEIIVSVIHGVGSLAVMEQNLVLIEVSKSDISHTNILKIESK